MIFIIITLFLNILIFVNALAKERFFSHKEQLKESVGVI